MLKNAFNFIANNKSPCYFSVHVKKASDYGLLPKIYANLMEKAIKYSEFYIKYNSPPKLNALSALINIHNNILLLYKHNVKSPNKYNKVSKNHYFP